MPKFSFSKITSQINKVNNAVASVNSLTRSAQDVSAKLNRIASSVGAITPEMNKIRDSVGDFTSLSTSVSPKQFNSLATSFTGQVFNPGQLDNLIRSPADIGNVAAAAGAISQQIQGLSNFGTTNVNARLSSGFQSPLGGNIAGITNALGTIQGVTGTLSRVSSEFGSSISSISSKISQFNGFDIGNLNSLVGSFSNFGNLISNPISVLAQDVSQLVGAVGGEFDKLRQLIETQQSINPYADYLDLSFKSPWDTAGVAAGGNIVVNKGAAASKIPNPLREHNHYNYVITLGILNSEEFNYPGVYRSSGDFVQNYIIKSSGGNLDKRYQIFDETAGNTYSDFGDAITSHAEYYIDNLDIDAVIAPNANTGTALGSAIKFDVVEPYSMGGFIEALIGSAAELGYANYINAPFCLKIDFIGYDEYGKNSSREVANPIYIPIMITKVDFSVQAKGSEYAVQAVPYSESGLDDNVQKSKTQINVTGAVVHEVLNGDEKSVMAVFNERVQELEQAKTIVSGDRFIIAFPKTPDALVNIIGNLKDQVATEKTALTINAAEQQRRERGLAQANGDISTARKQSGIDNNSVTAPSLLFNTLKAYASDTNNMNEIGLSTLVENTADGGQEAQADQSAAYDENGDVVDISNAETSKAEKARTTQFRQGETITSIVEKIVKKSKFARDNATEETTNGVRKWFKIDTQVFLDNNPSAESQVGSSPKIYVYSIIPYYSDEAKHTGTTQRPKNTEGLKALAPKQYNYFYTGKNEDVLNFDIQFNNQFFMTAFSNFGQNAATVATGGSKVATFQAGDDSTGSEVAAETSNAKRREPGAQLKEVNELDNPTGSESGDLKLRIAEQFHNTLLNQTVDMVTAEMEIWGDPFFLPQQTGNYVGKSSGNPSVLDDGTMNYLQSEIFCVVNFNSPFDYQVNGATMEMPKRVPQFSGLFSIWAVTNTFSKGKFTQNLKMIRRRGQDDEPTESTTAIKADGTKSINNANTEPGSPNAANNSVNSTTGAVNPCSTTSPISAINNLTASAEDLLMSQPLFPATSTSGGDDIAFSQPVVQIGGFAYSPNQSTFPSAPVNNNSGNLAPGTVARNQADAWRARQERLRARAAAGNGPQ